MTRGICFAAMAAANSADVSASTTVATTAPGASSRPAPAPRSTAGQRWSRSAGSRNASFCTSRTWSSDCVCASPAGTAATNRSRRVTSVKAPTSCRSAASPDGPGMSVAHAPMASHTIRRSVIAAAAVLLLAGPTILAFFSGGFFFEPRVIAAIAAWLLVLALAAVGPAPLPRSRNGWLAFGGLAGIAVWSAVSVSWAPRAGPAVESVERLVLYVGALLIAIGALRSRRVLRAVEPALAAGAALVIGYGLAGRLLPGIVHLAHSTRAGGRLEQPLTYWNAEGALAALGLVLCARLAGDRTRPLAMRGLAAAAAAPLGAGLYLSYSRGAIAAAVVGLIVLIAAVHSRSQLEAAAIILLTGLAAAAAAGALPGVASLAGDSSPLERPGSARCGYASARSTKA